MRFIFAETQGMQSAAASTAGLADDTVTAGGQAGGGVVVPPGLDPMSASNATKINAYTSEVATQLAAGAGLQVNYGATISGAATTYAQTDALNAIGLGG
jgi:hypothetical protein